MGGRGREVGRAGAAREERHTSQGEGKDHGGAEGLKPRPEWSCVPGGAGGSGEEVQKPSAGFICALGTQCWPIPSPWCSHRWEILHRDWLRYLIQVAVLTSPALGLSSLPPAPPLLLKRQLVSLCFPLQPWVLMDGLGVTSLWHPVLTVGTQHSVDNFLTADKKFGRRKTFRLCLVQSLHSTNEKTGRKSQSKSQSLKVLYPRGGKARIRTPVAFRCCSPTSWPTDQAVTK